MATPPPGWYRDPGGSGAWRWWDGWRWTEHLTAWPGAGSAGDWGRSVRIAGEAEARLSDWVLRVMWLYVAVVVASVAVTVVSLPSVVHWFRLGLENTGGLPPSEPAGLRAMSLLALPFEIVLPVVWLKWQYRSATTARLLGYPARRSPRLGCWSWVIPVVNIWFPYQALRDTLPPGHGGRAVLLRTWLASLLAGLVAVVAYATAFASLGLGVALGCVAIAGYVLVGSGAHRFLRAVAADHAGALARF